MITIPVILGILLSGFHFIHLCLIALWWIGYFCFFATTVWLRSGRKPSLFPPVRTYGAALVLPAIGLACFAPYLAWWLILFLPIIVVTVWETMHRRERSFLNDMATIVAASLMLPVAYDSGTTGICFEPFGGGGLWGSGYLADQSCHVVSRSLWQSTWLVTLLVWGYFIGTVFYVKTNIRERQSNNYLIASVVFHALFTLLAFRISEYHIVPLVHAWVWLLLTFRSLAVPLYGRYRHRLSVKKIGIGEIIFSLLVLITVL